MTRRRPRRAAAERTATPGRRSRSPRSAWRASTPRPGVGSERAAGSAPPRARGGVSRRVPGGHRRRRLSARVAPAARAGGAALPRPARAHRGRRHRARGARVGDRRRARDRHGGALAAHPPRGDRPGRVARRRGGAARASGLAGARRARRGHRDRPHVRQRGVRPVRERCPRPRGPPAPAGGVLMLHAIVSDVHANLEALEAVLADLAARGATDVVCLGDFVGYGASPNECIERLRPGIEAAVLGNHDQAALDPALLEYFNPEAAAAARWTSGALTPAHTDYLRALPLTVPWRGARLGDAPPAGPGGGGDGVPPPRAPPAALCPLPLTVPWRGARLVHASPAEPEAWSYVFTPSEAVDEMGHCDEPVCFVGHSHFPGTFEIDGVRASYTRDPRIAGRRDRRYLIVVPSVGQPRDGDPRAGYLLWDDVAWAFEHVRLDYDLEGAMRRINAAGLPAHLAERLRWGE